MKERHPETQINKEEGESQHPSSLELARMKAGHSKRVGAAGQSMPDSMLAVSKDKFTYTFIMEDDVASIHFDRARGEIFFRGHNIRNMELTHAEREALLAVEMVLEADEQGKEFITAYSATLGRRLADK